MTEYPTNRDSFYAHKLIRLMMRTCAAQEIGADAFLLVTIIVHTEDAKHYKKAVTFWNSQLESVCGMSWGRLDRARKRAISGGWLFYKSGGKGKVGNYWTITPNNLVGQADGSIDEDNKIILSNLEGQVERETDYPLQSGDANDLSSPPVERQPGDNRGTTGGQPGDKCGTFLPTPTPTPKNVAVAPKRVADPLGGSFDKNFQKFWAAYPRRVTRTKANQAYEDAVVRLSHEGRESSHSFLLERCIAFSKTPKARSDFCPAPATWLNDGWYDDDPKQWERDGNQSQTQRATVDLSKMDLGIK